VKIIRFQSGGRVYWGQPTSAGTALRIEGNIFDSPRVTAEILPINRLLSPLVPVDILCIGLNYRDHVAETQSQLPPNPMLFIKSSNTLNDPGADIQIPRLSSQVDYEGELAVIIGKTAKNVPRSRALEYVFGYTIANDVSARDWQKDKALNGGQFARGKSFDGFCPLGPCILTADDVLDPNKLTIKTFLNGQTVQNSSTAEMVFDVPALVESVSSTMTLRPGSIILTGTPSGVGMGRTPPLWLKAGDRIVVEIESIGRLENSLVDEMEHQDQPQPPQYQSAEPAKSLASEPPAPVEAVAAAPSVLEYQPAPKRPLGRWIVFMLWLGVLGLPVVATTVWLAMRYNYLTVGFYTVETMAVAGLGTAVVSLVEIDRNRQGSRRRRNALILGASLTFIWSVVAVLLGLTFIVRK
jgi:2-keto-4-pentenoate hydratase/2-oxohepta-3-ene-1,7-dioic acid hydratase in catechol pathway